MNSDIWQFENNICRCCHAEGFFLNLAEPRPFCGEMEVYTDMIKDVFNIEMRPIPGAMCELTYTICMSCVFKLREAIQFKKQVQRCEDRFIDLYLKNKLKVLSKDDIKKVKEEPNIDFKEEYLVLDNDFDSNNDADPDFDVNDDDIKSEEEVVISTKKGKGKEKAKPEETKVVPVHTLKKEVEKKKVPVKKKGNKRTEETNYILTEEGGTSKFTCKSCQNVFKKRDLLNQHYRHVHLKQRPKLRGCYYCKEKVPGHLRAHHLETVHDVPAPSCGACGKKFAYPFQVLRHQKTFHMGEKKFVCGICDMTFSSRGNLVQHEVKHSADRPFKCEYCDEAFKWRKHLTRHYMVHLNHKKN